MSANAFNHRYPSSQTTLYITRAFIAFGSADNEIRMINIYRRELAIANSTTLPANVREVSANVCADIIQWLGFTPDVNDTQSLVGLEDKE